jgi:ElaB/YqjD/DUF883 family membrane-anchored ribosome-binding protein
MAKAQRKQAKVNNQGISYRIFDDVLALAGTLLRSRKDFGADKLHALAEATRNYATSLTDLPTLRVQVASASESIEGLADYVMHTDIEHMVQDAGTFARRNPVATLGVTIAAGVVATRLMRSPRPDVKTSPKRGFAKKSRKQPAHPRRSTNGSAQAHA